jgi:hypothetical protein
MAFHGSSFAQTPLDALKITEIMYNPAEGGSEFLELQNTGDVALDVAGVSFSTGIIFEFPANTTIEAGAFFVLVPELETAQFTATYPGARYQGTYLNKLDGAGEKLAMVDILSVQFYEVTYNDSFPWPTSPDGLGFSLTILDPLGDPDDFANWRASGAIGGTPGQADLAEGVVPVIVSEALTHTDAPAQDAIEIHNPGSETADLRGWFLTDNRESPQKALIPLEEQYQIAPGGYLVIYENLFSSLGTPGTLDGEPLPGFSLSSQGGEGVYIYSADSEGNLTGYSHGFNLDAAENGVSFGRYVNADNNIQFIPQAFTTLGSANSAPKVGPLVISEIQYHPLDTDTEYLELTNISDEDVSLWDDSNGGDPNNTYEIRGIGFEFPRGVTISAGAKVLIVNSTVTIFKETYVVPEAVQVFGAFGNQSNDLLASLDNNGETITLQWPDTPDETEVPYITMDKVKYNDKGSWPDADGNGLVLRRINPAAYGNESTNWSAAISSYARFVEPVDNPHSADRNADGVVDLSEILRVVQLFNAEGYFCDNGTEDDFAPGIVETHDCLPHHSDFLSQDWVIDVNELLRAIQLFRAGQYIACLEGEDGFCAG